MARKPDPVEEGAPLWMLSYGDLVTQLLVFFVMLFSMSTVSAKKFAEVLGSIQGALGMGASIIVEKQTKSEDVLKSLMGVSEDLDKMHGTQTENIEGVYLNVTTVKEGLKITLGGKPLFDEGKAELLPEGDKALRRLAEMIAGYRNKVRVIGHTSSTARDALPGPTGKWDLGYARALAVVRHLSEKVREKERVHPARMEPSSAGPHQPAAAEAAKDKENRRVELIVTEELVPWDRLH